MRKIKQKIHTLQSLASLGWDWTNACKIVWAYVYISVIWKIAPRDVSVPVSIRWKNKRLNIFISSYGDLLSLIEVFIEEEYKLNVSEEVKTIVDAGVHVGYEALYFAVEYPAARILCSEPDPYTFSKLEKNIAEHPQISVYNLGFGGHDGTMSFHSSEHDSIASSFVVSGSDSHTIEVPVRTVKTFLTEVGVDVVDILKFDIEGMEVEMLRGCVGLDIRHFIGEIHFDLIEEDESWFRDYFSSYTLTMKPIAPERVILEAGPHYTIGEDRSS